MVNWLQCLRSRQRPVCDIAIGQQQTAAVVIAALAHDTGLQHRYDPATRRVIPG